MEELLEESGASKADKDDITDLRSLLDAVNSNEFSYSTGLTEEKKDFEKLESFFDIVKKNDEGLESFSDNSSEAGSNIESSVENSLQDEKSQPNEENTLDELEESSSENQLQAVSEKVEQTANLGTISDEVSKEDFQEESGKLDGNEATLHTGGAEQENNSTSSQVDNLDEIELENIKKDEFEKGYNSALAEFEKSMALEKTSLNELVESVFKINEKTQNELETFLKEEIFKLASEFIGMLITEHPDKFLKKIKTSAAVLISETKKIELIMNQTDFKLLEKNTDLKKLDFTFSCEPELRRGEFRLVNNGSGFTQKFNN
jgi:flagellar biosynthesis/type III secretory pathway protein FliH